MRGAWQLAAWVCAVAASVTQADRATAQGFAGDAELARTEDPEALFRYAEAAAAVGDAPAAIAALERLLAMEPGLSNIRLELGYLYVQTGETELGISYISDALQDPAMPPPVRQRALEILAEAQAADRRWTFFGNVTTGLRHDSNANSGPDGTVQFVLGPREINGRLDPEDTGQADASAYANLFGEARYDLGLQGRHQLVFSGTLYTEKYRDQTQLDLLYGNVVGGPELDLGSALGRPATATLDVVAAYLERDRERYLSELGLAAEAQVLMSERTIVRAGISGKSQEFYDTREDPLNDNQDGALYGAFAGITYDFDERTRILFDAILRDKTAAKDFEAYREIGAALSLSRFFPAPVAAARGDWEASLLASYSQVDYDDLDLSIDLDTAQRDRRSQVEAGLSVPVAARAAVLVRVGYFRNDSNFAIQEYDNRYAAVELGVDF
jgi:hypothetical protein